MTFKSIYGLLHIININSMLECSPFIQPVEASHLIESVIGAENLVPEKLTCVSESCTST